MTRRRLSVQQREEIIHDQDGLCALCGKFMSGSVPVEFDHALALGLGGDDDVENIVAVHKPCHRKKTTEDVGRMAKADRQGGKTGQRARRLKGSRAKIPGRKFDGTPVRY